LALNFYSHVFTFTSSKSRK